MSQRVIKPADAAPPKASTLPAKEAALFKQIAKFYDARQHKKALKAADAVLKKFPDHGETLSMKALVMSQMPGFDGPRKEEAMELAKKGLRNDLKSSVCKYRRSSSVLPST